LKQLDARAPPPSAVEAELSPALAATVEEPRKERTPVQPAAWASLQRHPSRRARNQILTLLERLGVSRSGISVNHAEGFYRCVESRVSTDPRAAYQVEQGLELGAYIFPRLYDDLFRARTRRVTRELSGSHSLALIEDWCADQASGGTMPQAVLQYESDATAPQL
jgi:hypothetical protein